MEQTPKQERFMKLFEPLNARLSRFVQTLVWNKHDAKDIISETILIAFENLDKLKSEDAFLSYLFSIATNLVNKKLRRKKFWGIFDSNKELNIPDNTSSESLLMLFELNKALQTIPAKQREALVYFEISGLTMNEIAEIQNLTVGGVKTNIARARKALAILLELHEPITNMKGIWYEQ